MHGCLYFALRNKQRGKGLCVIKKARKSNYISAYCMNDDDIAVFPFPTKYTFKHTMFVTLFIFFRYASKHKKHRNAMLWSAA